jgi:hypothetical protein
MRIFETNQEVINNAKKIAEEKGWELLHVRLFNENPADDYLKFVLVKLSEGNFATFLFNTSKGGFFVEGRYDFKTKNEAYDDLLSRK